MNETEDEKREKPRAGNGKKALVAGAAIGSAAIAAALLYASRRKKPKPPVEPHTPTGEKPETD
jgi:Na+/H+-translocating membrane pyrophosphatase